MQRFATCLAIYRGVDVAAGSGGVLSSTAEPEPGTDATHNSTAVPSPPQRRRPPRRRAHREPVNVLHAPGWRDPPADRRRAADIHTNSAALADNLTPSSTSVGGGTWTASAAAANATAWTVALAELATGPTTTAHWYYDTGTAWVDVTDGLRYDTGTAWVAL